MSDPLDRPRYSDLVGESPGSMWVLVLLGLLVAAQLWLLVAEVQWARADLNDSLFHLGVSRRMVEAIAAGENPLDCWVSDWSLGYPVPRTYQPLGHLGVALLYTLLGGAVPLESLFAWIRLALLGLLPLSFYVMARALGFTRWEALAAAFLSPLISTQALFGLEYGSFLWRGSGLFSQLVATHAFLWAVGIGFRGVREGRFRVTAGVLLALTLLSHLIYGYMAALSLVLVALLPSRFPRKERLFALGQTALVSLLLTAWFLIPIALDGALVNRSVWEPSWKWGSHGLLRVLEWAVSGELLDFGRFPSLTLLSLAGAGGLAWKWRKGKIRPGPRFVLAAALIWLFLYAGRVSWGPLMSMLALPGRVHLHRLLGGAQIFLLLAAALVVGSCLGFLFRKPFRPRRAAVLLILVPLLVFPVAERWEYVGAGDAMGSRNLQAVSAAATELEALHEQLASAPGRIFPGLAGGWGGELRVGDVPLYALISQWGLPAVSFLYHSMAQSGDLMVRFDERRPSHFRLFNISRVVADRQRPFPDWLPLLAMTGRFQVRSADGGGYFDLVKVPLRAHVGEPNHYPVNDAWLQSDWPDRRLHIRLDADSSPGDLPALPIDLRLPRLEIGGGCGLVLSEARLKEHYSALVEASSPCYLLFKMTYHPNWRVTIDERPGPPVVNLTPGFVGVPLKAGRHLVRLEYRAEPWKTGLLWVGILSTLLLALASGRLQPGFRLFWETALRGLSVLWSRPGIRTATLTLLICLPVIIPLSTGWLPGGHDVFEYLGRQVEFHENIRNGVLLPAWAGDLSSGFGQPFFEFNPPLFYYLGEIGVWLGLGWVKSLNLATLLLVLLSAASARLLGRFWFQEVNRASLSPQHAERVGWLASIAYIYAPYFAVDLYVRRALAEFTAFAFYPLALYGFARYAVRGSHGGLVLGAVSYAAIIASHLPSALLFSPLLAGFILWSSWRTGSWRRFGTQLLGFGAGLGLTAFVWAPPALERDLVSVDRLLEGYLHFSNHFVHLQQLVYSAWGYGLSVAGYRDDGMSFSLGTPHWILLLLVFLIAFRRTRRTSQRPDRLPAGSGFLMLALSLGIFFLIPESEFLWQRLPWLQYVEFPWRILAVAALCMSLLVASLIGWLGGRSLENPVWFAAVSALLILPGLSNLAPPNYFVVDPQHWTPAQIALRGVAVTTRQEYEPGGFTSGWMSPDPYQVVAGAVRLTGYSELSHQITFDAEVDEEATLVFRKSYFPGWEAGIDAISVPVLRNDRGWITLQVGAGRHRVRLRFRGSPARRLGEWISLISLIALLLGWISQRSRDHSKKELPGRRPSDGKTKAG